MFEIECTHCGIPLRIPGDMMGKGGTCNHCRGHFETPSLLRYRTRQAMVIAGKIVGLPFAFAAHLVRVNSRPNEFEDMSPAEILIAKESRKQTKIARANRSDTSCCLGCIVILLLLMGFGFLGPLLALIGLGGMVATQ